MYATLEQFKSFLHITDSSQDTLLTTFLQASESIINWYCWVDTFSQQDNEELIDVRGIYENCYGLFFYVKNYPVNTVSQINNEAYSGVKWTDYLVVNSRELIFKKLPQPPMWFLQVKYNSWFQTIPGDLQLAEMMIASGLRQQHGNEWVSSYKLWDEQIVFWSKATNDWDTDLAYFKVKTMLDKYKIFNLPV